MHQQGQTTGRRGAANNDTDLDFDFDRWAKAVRAQMLDALKRRGSE